jgi:hypothetical protein
MAKAPDNPTRRQESADAVIPSDSSFAGTVRSKGTGNESPLQAIPRASLCCAFFAG